MSLLLLLALTSLPTESFALVVTNNRSLNEARADLRYADDDGVAYARVFDDLFGPKHTVLLTQLDADTRALAPGLASTPTPTLQHLDEAVAALAASAEAAKVRGSVAELFLVFAAHGNLENGSGYLELLDGRLDAAALETRVIKPLASASRLHLIIDSCNSYFMLNPRKTGGRRWAAAGLPDTSPLTTRYPNLGTFISTSAEADSYEWSELQSGIFSYEVRSGLRGAADADGNGSVSYDELAAFVARANQDIPNAQYRPRVAWSAPNGQANSKMVELVAGSGRIIVSNAAEARRFTVRDRYGVRVADVHQEAGSQVTLVVPDEPHALGLFIAQAVDPRPRWVYRAIPPAFRGDIDLLTDSEAPTGARGDAPIFDSLFARPFGKNAFAEYVASPVAQPEPVFGVAREDIQRLDQHLQNLVEDDRAERVLTTSLYSDSLAVYQSVRVSDVGLLLRRLRSYDVTSDEARSRALLLTERDFERVATETRDTRLTLGTIGLIASGAVAGVGLARGASGERFDTLSISMVVFGGLGGLGSAIALGYITAVEREWASWLTRSGQTPPAPGLEVSLLLGPTAIGLSGRF